MLIPSSLQEPQAARDTPHACAVAPRIATACAICGQLADIDGRYFGRLLRDARARGPLAQSISTHMGFCADHIASIAALGEADAVAMQTASREAGRHLGILLERAGLQDELIQDILFGARNRCPACSYFHRSEGRALARVLHAAGHDRRASMPPLCFVHAQRLLQRAEAPLSGRLLRLLRAKARNTPTAAVPGNTEGFDGDALRSWFYPLAHTAGAPDGSAGAATHATACPVCMAVVSARHRWLAAVVENVRLGQPGWITLPTCSRHLLACFALPEAAVRQAALAHYLEAALPRRPASPPVSAKRRRRHVNRWFDSAASRPPGCAADPADVPRMSFSCPGCDAEEIAARRAVATLIRAAARMHRDDAVVRTISGVCLKHFAELLIYAPDPTTARRLSHALCAILLDGRG